MRTHFWGPLHLIQAVLPSMRQRHWKGRIVNIASIGGKIAVPHMLPYSASKFALVGLSEGLRSELAKDGIVVTTVCPGLIRTGSPRNAHFKGQNHKEYAWFALSDSLPGISMSAEGCADQIVDALRHGDAEIVTSLVAQVAALAHGVAPGLVTDVLGLVNGYLPSAEGAGIERFTGAESESLLTRSPLTALTRLAETRNNQR
jgi:short-subunit dehydrogenase